MGDCIKIVKNVIQFFGFLFLLLAYQNCGKPLQTGSISESSSSGNIPSIDDPMAAIPDGTPPDAMPVPPAPSPAPAPVSTPPSRISFPGAEGFGRFATGGRGGRVLYVNSLADRGSGTLRWALEEQTGPRIVLFAISGILRARTQIQIRSGDVTVAGQSAPGDGFIITGARINVAANNVVLRGLKVRPGDDPNGDAGANRDAISVGVIDREVSNVMVDSNSLSWSVDETFTTWYSVRNVSFSRNIVAEPLNNSIHIDEGATQAAPHPMCVLVGQDSSYISVFKNIFSDCGYRSPLARAENMEIINNLIYDYGPEATTLDGDAASKSNVINNIYIAGTNSVNRQPLAIPTSYGTPVNYISGNISIPFRRSLSEPETNLMRGSGATGLATQSTFSESGIRKLSALSLESYFQAHAGARYLGRLDSVDQRILSEVVGRTGRLVNSPTEVGGYNYSQLQSMNDADLDGIPDGVESQYFGSPAVFDSQSDKNNNGYPDIEDYLNSLLPSDAMI